MGFVMVFMIKFLNNFIFLILFFLSLILMMNYPLWGQISSEMTYHLSNSLLSQVLCILTVWVTIFMIIASSYNQMKFYLYFQLFSLMCLFLWVCFKINTIILFYFLFETVLIPIFLMILGWGYQPERLMASINLFLYTVFASLPLLLSFILVNKFIYSTNFTDFLNLALNTSSKSLIYYFLSIGFILSFMVKYPLFSAHLWLPKAHVEASVAGSMMLAAILLKLGGYGLLRVLPVLTPTSFVINFSSSFALIGGGMVSFLCLRQTDTKILIAYSSVAHMSLVIAASFSQCFMGWVGAILLMIAHGITSSGMFSAANIMYERWKTRNILLSKSMMSTLPIFSLWWFLLCVCNMGGPPSLNLLSEIMSIMAIMNMSMISLLPLTLIIGLAVAYNLILYASSQQGQLKFSKSYAQPMSFREISLLSSHVFLSMMLSVKMNLIF